MGVVWRFELLGGLSVVGRERVIQRFGQQKAAVVLGYLAYHRGRAVPREVLIELAWPDGSPANGRNSLSVALSGLRAELEPHGVRPGAVLVSDRHEVRLREETTATDVEAFLARAQPSADLQSWLAALDLYRGELLSGQYVDWITQEQLRLEGLFLETCRRCVAALESAGRPERALDVARRALHVDPFEERFQLDVVRLLTATGRRAAAVDTFAEFSRRLEQERQAAPSASLAEAVARLVRSEARFSSGGAAPAPDDPLPTSTTTVLLAENAAGAAVSQTCTTVAEAVRAAQPLAADPTMRLALATAQDDGAPQGEAREVAAALLAAAAPGACLCDEPTAALARRLPDGREQVKRHGIYRLPGLSEPVAVFALHGPDGAAPPPLAEQVGADTLPTPLGGLLGRAELLSEVRERLTAGARLVTLTGPGGTGKTRLAAAVARDAAAAFAAGPWWIDLVPLRDADDLVRAIAHAVRGASAHDAISLDGLVALLANTAGAPQGAALLVLDNAEHVLEPTAEVVEVLLSRLPRLAALVTSRQRLGLAGEAAVAVPPLAVPQADAPVDRLGECPSVQLFCERAREARPGFRLSETNAAAIAGLCVDLEGLPLAIELAAARTGGRTPQQIREHLGERLDWQSPRRRKVRGRHDTLRSALAWSWQLLDDDERDTLAAVSVCRGSFGPELAGAVAQRADVADLLASLRDASLLEIEEADVGLRFRLLETVRQFAREQLDGSGRANEVLGRYAAWVETFFAARDLNQEGARPEWIDELEAELEHWRAVVEWATVHDPQCAARTIHAAAVLHERQARSIENERHAAACLAALGPSDAQHRLLLLLTLGTATEVRDPARCVVYTDEAVALAERLDQPLHLLVGLVTRGLAHKDVGRTAAAASDIEQAVELSRRLAQPRHLAGALVSLAAIRVRQGRLAEAVELAEEALAAYTACQDHAGAAWASAVVARCRVRRGELAAARAAAVVCEAAAAASGSRTSHATALDLLAGIEALSGDTPAAIERLVAAEQRWQGAAEVCQAVQCRTRRARALAHLGRWDEAEALAASCLVAVECGCNLAAEAHRTIGDIHALADRPGHALRAYQTALASCPGDVFTPLLPRLIESLQALAAQLGHTDSAARLGGVFARLSLAAHTAFGCLDQVVPTASPTPASEAPASVDVPELLDWLAAEIASWRVAGERGDRP